VSGRKKLIEVALPLEAINREAANRVRALISKIFAFGLARDIVEVNPVAGLPRPGEERRRQRVLTEEEIWTLWGIWEAEASISSAAFRMLLLTAQRKQEVLTMRWADVHGACPRSSMRCGSGAAGWSRSCIGGSRFPTWSGSGEAMTWPQGQPTTPF
jgi:site-specific recombinase XerD